MENPSQPDKGTIELPVHILDSSIFKMKFKKLFFQFEVYPDQKGGNAYRLVAYPAYKEKGEKWKIGDKIEMAIKEGTKPVLLPLPLSLGNLEVTNKELTEMMEKAGKEIIMTPTLYTRNQHATYTLSDGSTTLEAHPSPPAPPDEGV